MQTTFHDFQNSANRTSKFKDDICMQDNNRVLMGCLGLAGEAGELIDGIKKCVFHGHILDRDAMRAELGDVLYYLAELCSSVGFTLEEVAAHNIEKLTKRYPDGFNKEASLHKKGCLKPLSDETFTCPEVS